MIYAVEVELRHSTIKLLLKYLCDEGVRNNETDNEKKLKEGVKIFLSILQDSVKNRLDSLVGEKGMTKIITSQQIILEGQGGVELSDPPTEAQNQLIRSLLKVVLHQFTNQTKDFITSDGNHNLLLSIFIRKITIEMETSIDKDPRIFSCTGVSIDTIISSILEGGYKPSALSNPTKTKDYLFYFFTLPDQIDLEYSNILLNDFNKIDLDDTNIENLEDSTIISQSPRQEQLFSRETLENVKVTTLPSRELEGVWESLFFENDMKKKIFNHGQASIKINEYLQPTTHKEELPKLFASNKIILLHGPPGTGKTTLCRSLAQKLIIRKNYSNIVDSLNSDFNGLLIELSCARVFSRWFGESSKNLECIFKDLKRILSSPKHKNSFVCLLIDEVETIAGSRKDILSKNESSDSVRVVNTLLTQIDSLKHYKNFLILATSNLVDSLDPAFVDRADGVFYIGSPSANSISNILMSLINSLFEINIISSRDDAKTIIDKAYYTVINKLGKECRTLNLSGRIIRKLPLLCLSEYFCEFPVPLENFLIALALTIKGFNKKSTEILKSNRKS